MRKARTSRQPGSGEATPLMSRREIAQFRLRPKQLVCIDMLREGNHRSFTELYSLLRTDRYRRTAAEPGSVLLSRPPLEEQPDKLQLIRRHLTRSEEAGRTGTRTGTGTGTGTGTREEVFEQRLVLARLLSDPVDVWLRLHFLRSVEVEAPEDSRSSTESKLSLTEEFLRGGDLQGARQQVEVLLRQVGVGPPDSDGARRRLLVLTWTTFSRLAAALLDAGDPGGALPALQRAHDAATEMADRRLEAESAFQLGRANQRAGNQQAARQFFNACREISGALDDTERLLEAHMATVQSLESEGSHDEVVQCLEEIVHVAESKGLKEKQAETLWLLGNNFYHRNLHQRAWTYFLQGSKVASDIGNVSLLEKSQVMAAITRAHCLAPSYMSDVASSSPSALRRLRQCKAAGGARDPDEDDGSGDDDI